MLRDVLVPLCASLALLSACETGRASVTRGAIGRSPRPHAHHHATSSNTADVAPRAQPGPTPLTAPVCASLRLAAVSAASEDRDSLATFELPGGAQITKRFGGRVDDARVVYVGQHPQRGPSAWLLRARKLCQLSVFGPRVEPPHAPTAATTAAGGVLSRVQGLGAGQYRVDRGMLLALLDQPERLARGMQGMLQGDAFVIRRLSEASPLRSAGLAAGDRIVAVGGVPVRDPQGLLRLLAGAARRPSLEVRVLRGGHAHTLEYRFE